MIRLNDYSQRQISDFLELPLTTAKKRLYDSRKRLKECLRERTVDLVNKSLRHYSLPNHFTDIVVRKVASLKELEKASAFIDYSARQHPEHFASVDAAEKAGVYVVDKDGEVVGAGYFSEATWSIGSTMIRRACIDEIGGEGRGVPDPAFEMGCKAALKLAKELKGKFNKRLRLDRGNAVPQQDLLGAAFSLGIGEETVSFAVSKGGLSIGNRKLDRHIDVWKAFTRFAILILALLPVAYT